MLWSWGENSAGQLGYNTLGNDQLSPRRIVALKRLSIAGVAAGGNHSTCVDGMCASDFGLLLSDSLLKRHLSPLTRLHSERTVLFMG